MATRAGAWQAPDVVEDDKQRVLAGLAAAVAQKGYGATTIADIVRHARVSKRTFYEHFADKEACFLAAYWASSRMLQGLLVAAQTPEAPAAEQVEVIVRTYLQGLELDAASTRTFMLEIYAAGPKALAMRRQVLAEFADLLLRLSRAARKRHPGLRAPSRAMTAAIVGAINELVLMALERGERLAPIATTACELVRAVLLSAPT